MSENTKKKPKYRGYEANGFEAGIAKIPNLVNNNAASDNLNKLSDELSKLVASRAKCTLESNGGYGGELHHKYTILVDAAKKGNNNIEIILGPRGGNGSKGSADLTVIDNGTIGAEAGLKYKSSPAQTTFDQSNPYDFGRQKICPADQAERVAELAAKRASSGTLKQVDYADTVKNATDRLRYKEYESRPLTKQESIDIVKDPARYAREAVRNDYVSYIKNSAIVAATLYGTVSLAQNLRDCINNEKTVGQAVEEVVKDTIVGGTKGAVVGLGGAATKQVLIKVGAKNLAKGTAPIVIASSALEAAGGIKAEISRFVDGEITGDQAIIKSVGHTVEAVVKGGTTWVGAEIGAAIGAVAGPIGIFLGGLIGGVVAYTFADNTISSAKALIT